MTSAGATPSWFCTAGARRATIWCRWPRRWRDRASASSSRRRRCPRIGGGRAWWHLDPDTRPPHAQTDALAPGFRPTPAVVASRSAVQGLLGTIVNRYAPTTVALVGFSQGAMLAIDVALSGTPAVQRVVALSGVVLVDSVPALRSPAVTRPAFFLANGRQDPVVPFEGGSRAKALLEAHGFSVTWRPFAGGHGIPEPLLAEVDRFLFPEAARGD